MTAWTSTSTSTSYHGVARAAHLMTAFAKRTGLDSGQAQCRYLWTDAFAVGNFFGLARVTGEGEYAELALRLVDRVHHELGRQRSDDGRAGWISGRAEAEGEAHPTCGGLRIGKKLAERRIDQPFDENLEWERDGQYFHYLTKWMHALCQTARWTEMPVFVAWARELGKAAYDAFVWTPEGCGAGKRIYWKMSIDLSRALVPSLAQHDAIDGYLACLEAEAAAARMPAAGGPSLAAAARDFAAMIELRGLATADPLGTGGLLTNAYLLDRLAAEGAATDADLVDSMLAAALVGLEAYVQQGGLRGAAEHRLAFREAGLALGLEAAALLNDVSAARADVRPKRRAVLEALGSHRGLAEETASFWLAAQPLLRDGSASEHRDIDDVMLAAALVPQGFLTL